MRISDWSSDVCSSDLMLPRPRALALVARETVERDRERPLIARRPQPRVDLVERPGRGRHRQRARHALRQPVVIMNRAERLGAIRSEEHTSELPSLMRISYAVFCLKKKKNITIQSHVS